MNLATWSIRNPIPAILMFVLLTFAGISGFVGLPIQNRPDLSLPAVTVTAMPPGAAPAQLETEVARRIEDSLAPLDGLKHVTTSITDGVVQIQARFGLEKPVSDALIAIKDALIAIKDAIDGVRSELPTDLLQPTVTAATFVGDATLVYAIGSSRMDEEARSWFVDDRLAKAVRAVPGVGRFAGGRYGWIRSRPSTMQMPSARRRRCSTASLSSVSTSTAPGASTRRRWRTTLSPRWRSSRPPIPR